MIYEPKNFTINTAYNCINCGTPGVICYKDRIGKICVKCFWESMKKLLEDPDEGPEIDEEADSRQS